MTQEKIAERYPELSQKTISRIIQGLSQNRKDAEMTKDDLYIYNIWSLGTKDQETDLRNNWELMDFLNKTAPRVSY